MSFWDDASGVVKGAIVIGVLGLVYFAIAFVADLPPFGGGVAADGEVTQQRGIQPPSE